MRVQCECAACNMKRLREKKEKETVLLVLTKKQQDILRLALKRSVKEVNHE